MEDFTVVNVLHAETDLGEPIHNLWFRKVPTTLVRDEFGEVTTVCEIHDDAQVSFFGFVEFSESDNVWMVKYF